MEDLGNWKLFGKVSLLIVVLPHRQSVAVVAKVIILFSAFLQ